MDENNKLQDVIKAIKLEYGFELDSYLEYEQFFLVFPKTDEDEYDDGIFIVDKKSNDVLYDNLFDLNAKNNEVANDKREPIKL